MRKFYRFNRHLVYSNLIGNGMYNKICFEFISNVQKQHVEFSASYFWISQGRAICHKF